MKTGKKLRGNNMKIAFDIDGTLQGRSRKVAWLHRELLKFANSGHDVIVWSGGGMDYAQRYVDQYNLPARVVIKCSEEVDIAFDDVVDFLAGAKLTIQVPSE